MCKFSSKSEGVPFQILFFLGDLTRNDPSAITNCLHGCSYSDYIKAQILLLWLLKSHGL